MKKEIKISEENALNAYKNASPEGKELLEHLLGKELFKPKDIRDRVKTFEDACNELGQDHPLVVQYLQTSSAYRGDALSEDLIAYLKVRIITAALNEGWTPQFTTDEYRYYPWFVLYTQKEIDEMKEENKRRVLGRSVNNAHANAGVAYSSTSNASTYSNTGVGGRLCFKTEELAEYAGKQFLDIWAEFMMFTTNGK
jgi:hypothetical protein